MVILAAIGRFFKKIWDWIKSTAWIQPLLIVGIIFGVIFSIPSIVKAVKAGKDKRNEYEAYYHNFQISLELNNKDDKFSSPADKFTLALENVMNKKEGAEESFRKDYKDLGDKFFVAFVGEDCDKCKDAKDGFALFEEKLEDKKDKAFHDPVKNNCNKFGMVTIFTDEETSYTGDDTAFVQYLDRHQSFFETVGSLAYETDYFKNEKLSETDLEYLETADPVNFLTPTIFLVELGDKVQNEEFGSGVQEIMFGVGTTSDDENAKAKILYDCWTHQGDFSVNDNK